MEPSSMLRSLLFKFIIISSIIGYFAHDGKAQYQPQPAQYITAANDGTTGTTLYYLAKITSLGTAILPLTTDTTGQVVGIVSGGAGTGAFATISITGNMGCVFDNSTTVRDFVVVSPTTRGKCHDAGASFPSSGQVIGNVSSIPPPAGATATVDMNLKQTQAATGGSSGVSSFNTRTGAITTVSGDIPNNAANTSGSAGSLSASSALPNGTTSTTQSQNDNSTKNATTAYTDLAVANAVAGINPAIAVQAASIANITGYTYSNGVFGVGATLAQNSAAIVVIDGYTVLLGDRILFKNQSTGANNGVYNVTTLGTGIIPAIFTRALDYDQPSDINNTGIIPVINGTVNAPSGVPTGWVITSKVTTVGTDPLTYVQFSSGGGSSGITYGVGVYASLPSCTSILNEVYVFTDSIYNQATCLTGQTSWIYIIDGKSKVYPAISGTWANQSTDTLSTTNGGILFQLTAGASPVSFYWIAYPTAPFTLDICGQPFGILATSLEYNTSLGISDGTKIEGFGTQQNSFAPSANATIQSQLGLLTGPSLTAGYTANIFTVMGITRSERQVCMRLNDDATNRNWSYSSNGGLTWDLAKTEGNTTFLTSTRIGIALGNPASGTPTANGYFWLTQWNLH